MHNRNLQALAKRGQSIWFDNLSRDVLQSGELAQLIDAGITGLTSNPTIFKKAIADSASYDRELSRLAGDAEGVGTALMAYDVAAAADLLLPVFERTAGWDGFASIEVSPLLAHDTQRTIQAAKYLWEKLARPNIMIKIPATKEGLPAIRQVLEDGINVNVTLLFSVDSYRQVASAYIEALERRRGRGLSIQGVRSVASFFVSRVDAIAETAFGRLLASGRVRAESKQEFFGRLGVANAILAYQTFCEVFGAEQFTRLAGAGAIIQRPLWASTGTKNPALNPLLYVEELAFDKTVNTVPPATLRVLMDKPELGLTELYPAQARAARSLIDNVNSLGLDFDGLLSELLVQGVELFAESYRDLVQAIVAKKSSKQAVAAG